MRVLITGATGFIGRRLQKTLISHGHQPVAVLRPGVSHDPRLEPACETVNADLLDSAALSEAAAGCDAVIYNAGSVRGREPQDFRLANVDGVAAMRQALTEENAKLPLLLISSLAASRPEVSHYAASKCQGEQALRDKAGTAATIFRPPAVYGPGDREMLPILKLARRGWVTPAGPADQRLSLIHADDLCSAVLAWLDNSESCAGRTYTLDDGRDGGYDWPAIARICSGGRYRRVPVPRWLLASVARANLALSRVLGYMPMLTPGKARELTQPDWVGNNEALTRDTGWTPNISLEDGVKTL